MADDVEDLGGRRFVNNRSEVSGEIVVRLRSVVHQLDYQLLYQVHHFGGQALAGLGIRHHYDVVALALLLLMMLMLLHVIVKLFLGDLSHNKCGFCGQANGTLVALAVVCGLWSVQ